MTMTKDEAHFIIGMKESEIVEVTDIDAGTLVVTKDGNALVIVDEPVTWAGGETRVLLARPPTPDWQGNFPVLERSPAPDSEIAEAIDAAVNDDEYFGGPLDEMDRQQIVDLVRTHQLDVHANSGTPKLIEALRAHAAAALAAADEDPDA